jgi:hypothetical protein
MGLFLAYLSCIYDGVMSLIHGCIVGEPLDGVAAIEIILFFIT